MEVAAPPTAFSITPTTSYSRTTGRCWDFTQRWRDSRSRGCVPHAVLGFESLGLKHVALSQDSTPAWPQARASSPVRGATERPGFVLLYFYMLRKSVCSKKVNRLLCMASWVQP